MVFGKGVGEEGGVTAGTIYFLKTNNVMVFGNRMQSTPLATNTIMVTSNGAIKRSNIPTTNRNITRPHVEMGLYTTRRSINVRRSDG